MKITWGKYNMDINYTSYDYPPSKLIKQYGQVLDDSHYFAKGHIGEGDEAVQCEFEVAYTQDCKLIIICYTQDYIDFSDIELPAKIVGKGLRKDISYGEDYEERITLENIRLIDDIKEIWGEYGLVTKIMALRAERVLINYGNSRAINWLENTKWQDINSDMGYRYAITGLSMPQMYKTEEENNETQFAGLSLTCNFDSFNIEIESVQGMTEYANDPNGELTVDGGYFPSNWTPDDIATVFCALFSLAIGKDIQWLKRHVGIIDVDYDYQGVSFQDLWSSKRSVFGQRSCHAFIIDGQTNLSKEHIEKRLQEFLQITISTAFQISKDDVLSYIDVIRHFIEYQIITDRHEDQARLIVTAVEELLANWLINNNLSTKGTFRERLNLFFSSSNHIVSIANASNFDDKISGFIKTRNKIAHEGRFSKSSVTDIEAEYQNMLLILPMMIFKIFGYQSTY